MGGDTTLYPSYNSFVRFLHSSVVQKRYKNRMLEESFILHKANKASGKNQNVMHWEVLLCLKCVKKVFPALYHLQKGTNIVNTTWENNIKASKTYTPSPTPGFNVTLLGHISVAKLSSSSS